MKKAGKPRGKLAESTSLLHDLCHADRDKRMAACIRLAEIGGRTAVKGLTQAANDSAPGVRGTVAILLGDSRSKLVTGVLLQLLRDTEPKVRAMAARSLGLRKEKNAVPYLREALRHASEDEVGFIVRSLRDIGDPAVAEDIAALLTAPQAEVRWSAAEALALLGDLRAADCLRGLEADPEIPATRRRRIRYLLRRLRDRTARK